MTARSLAARLLAAVEQWLHADAMPATQFKKAVRKQGAAAQTLRDQLGRSMPLERRLVEDGATEKQAAAVKAALSGMTDPAADFATRRLHARSVRALLRAMSDAAERRTVAETTAAPPVGHERKDLFG